MKKSKYKNETYPYDYDDARLIENTQMYMGRAFKTENAKGDLANYPIINSNFAQLGLAEIHKRQNDKSNRNILLIAILTLFVSIGALWIAIVSLNDANIASKHNDSLFNIQLSNQKSNNDLIVSNLKEMQKITSSQKEIIDKQLDISRQLLNDQIEGTRKQFKLANYKDSIQLTVNLYKLRKTFNKLTILPERLIKLGTITNDERLEFLQKILPVLEEGMENSILYQRMEYLKPWVNIYYFCLMEIDNFTNFKNGKWITSDSLGDNREMSQIEVERIATETFNPFIYKYYDFYFSTLQMLNKDKTDE